MGEILALCVASHHTGLIDCITPSGRDNLSRRMDKADSESHFEEVWRNADASVRERSEQLLQDTQLVKGISDIIIKICQADKNKNLQRFKVGLLTRFLFSCLIDADRTDTADSAKPVPAAFRQHGQYVPWPVLADLLEKELEKFSGSSVMDNLRGSRFPATPRPPACQLSSRCPKGIYTCGIVPTGGGKTLASLRFALNHAAKHGESY